MPGAGLILSVEAPALTDGAFAGLVGTVRLLCGSLSVFARLHAISSQCPASWGQPVPGVGGMSGSLSEDLSQGRGWAGEVGLPFLPGPRPGLTEICCGGEP